MSFRACPSPGEAEPEGAGCRSTAPAGAGPAERSRSGALRPREGRSGSASAAPGRTLALLSKLGRALLYSAPRGSSDWFASCRSVGLFRCIFVVLLDRTRSTQKKKKKRHTLSRRERVVRAGAGISLPAVISLAQAPACVAAAGTLSSVSRLPPGVEVESCPSPVPAAATGRAPPPAPASARLVQDAHPGGAPAASRPRLSAATLSCSPFISVAQCGAARRERGPGGRGGEEGGSAGLSSSAGSFCQATKSWPLSGSGLKFSREIEAGVRSALCEMAGGGQRARGWGFVAANHP